MIDADFLFLPKLEDPKILAKTVAEKLEDAIIFGGLPGGARLVENDICNRTGVSRSPVREAFQILERNGLVVRAPRKGVRVTELSIDYLDELYICRVPLEVTAVRLAVKNATDDEISQIQECHLECQSWHERGDVVGHFRANLEMSRKISEAGHNRPLKHLLETIRLPAMRYRFVAYKASENARKNSLRSNSDLVDALMVRDEDRAAGLMREGIETSYELIRESLLKTDQAGRRKARS